MKENGKIKESGKERKWEDQILEKGKWEGRVFKHSMIYTLLSAAEIKPVTN